MTTFYMVHASLNGEAFVHETTPAKAGREETIRGLIGGQFVGEIERVSYVNLATGTITDASRAIAEEIQSRSYANNDEPAAATREWVESLGLDTYREPAEPDWYPGSLSGRRAA